MASRTVKIGLMTYTRPDGLLQVALNGSKVDVHDDDLERFDRYNGAPDPEPEAKPKARVTVAPARG